MLNASISCFIFAIIANLFGSIGIPGLSPEEGKRILILLLVAGVLGLFANLYREERALY